MKIKEEIEQLAFLEYPRVINDPYNPMEDDNDYERKIWIDAYTKCQEDMDKKLIKNNEEWAKQCAEISKECDNKYTEEDMISFAYQFSSINVSDFRKHLKDFDVNLKEKNK